MCRLWTVLLLICCQSSLATHFRGSIISWRPGATRNEVIVDYRISWRRSYGADFYCDDDTIKQGTKIGAAGNGDFECISNCVGVFDPLYYQCTDYSQNENWSSGRGNQTLIFPNTTDMYYEFGFIGEDWIPLQNGGGGSWVVHVKANLQYRPDNGKINSSPTVDMAPIVRLQQGCNHTITLPVNDIDGDTIRCRWAVKDDTVDECGSVCKSLPAVVYEDTCTITYYANGADGWYAVAVQVEDFINQSTIVPLSSVPVQFLVNVYQSNENCDVRTEFVEPTPLAFACIGVPRGEVYEVDIIARVANENRSISEIKTTSPLGMIKSPLTNISKTDWKVNVTWSPQDYNTVTNVFCFVAIEAENGLQSDRRCITLLAGVDSGPTFVSGSQSPVGMIFPDHNTWSIDVNKDFTRTSRLAYIRVLDEDSNIQEVIAASDPRKITIDQTNRRLQFHTSTIFQEKREFYITFDFGVIKGTTYCGADSPAMSSSQFWRVSIRDITPPILTFINKPSITNGTTFLQWRIDEPATSTCSLTKPSGLTIDVTPCNGSWLGEQLTDGSYLMEIRPTDTVGNIGLLYRATWRVDTIPPVVTLVEVPSAVNNLTQVKFLWRCDEYCTTKCRVSIVGGTASTWSSCYRSHKYILTPQSSAQLFMFEVLVADKVQNTADVLAYNWTADFSPPAIDLCQDGDNLLLSCTSSLQPDHICNVTANDNVDQSPSLSYIDDSGNYCGLERTWTAVDSAGNVAILKQEIRISDNGPFEVMRRPGNINVACGTQHDPNMTNIFISFFEIDHPCHIPVHFTYVDEPDTDTCGVIIRRTWTISDDCGNSKQVSHLIQVLQIEEPISPTNGQTEVDLNAQLRWQRYGEGARYYSIFVWEYHLSRQKNPIANTSTLQYRLTNLNQNTRYLWQLEVKIGLNESYIGPIWGFETRKYVDLIVTSVDTPPGVFSGNTYQIRWTVENVGDIATQQQYWHDAYYLSRTNSFENAIYKGRIRQHNIIATHDGYSSEGPITFANGETGYFYVFVMTDYRGYLDELNTTNNLLRSISSINVELTPPPDLIVSSITAPTRSFSGSMETIRWTVLNNGEGNIVDGRWNDVIWWARSNKKDGTEKRLAIVPFSGNLNSNDKETRNASVMLPEFITGDYYLLVETDVDNNIYEYTNENNNIQATQHPTYVILTPPPDLELTALHIGTNFKTGDNLTVTWNVTNVGYAVPSSQRYWSDKVVLASTTTKRELVLDEISHFGSFSSGEMYSSSISYQLGQNIQTDIYDVIVTTNAENRLFEYNAKANNHKQARINIARALPDLQITNFTMQIRKNNSGNELHAHWKVENRGDVKALSNYWVDSLYAVRNGIYSNNDILLRRAEIYNGLDVKEVYERYEIIFLPQTVYGNVNFILNIDDVYKSSGDNDKSNHSYISDTFIVPLFAPNLKLLTNISTTEAPISEMPLLVSYTVVNEGIDVEHGSQWSDTILITPSSECAFTTGALKVVKIINISLNVNEFYSGSALFTIPKEMTGNYFVCVKVNSKNELFEGNNLENNLVFKEISIENTPASDLNVVYIHSTFSGKTEDTALIDVQWKIENKGNTVNNIVTGVDSIGYSRDRSMESFVELNSFVTEYALETNGVYEQQRGALLSSSLYGEFYMCVYADSTDALQENLSKRNNFACEQRPWNIQRPTKGRLSAVIDNLRQYSESESEIEITFSVQNNGQMTTLEKSWIDSVYVSVNEPKTLKDLKENGYNLANILHIGALKHSHAYTSVHIVNIPTELSGDVQFYILPNNSLTDTIETPNQDINIPVDVNFTNIFQFSNSLPNLMIKSNTNIDELNGGEPLVVDYNVVNNGQTNTFGIWYDAIYLSEDFTLDVFDIKLKSAVRNIQMGINETHPFNITVKLPLDLETKSYYILIVCDSKHDIVEENENDNIARVVFRLLLRSSTDLLVTNIVSQNEAEFGKSIKVEWEIRNNGTDIATGYKCDTAYLSEDDAWDIDDSQISNARCSHFSISPSTSNSGQQFHHSLVEGNTPLLASQSYYTIVKSRSNVIDLNPANDEAVAEDITLIVTDVLHLSTPLTKTLKHQGVIMLEIIEIPLDETLIVSVSSDDDYVSNSLFVKAGKAPTLYDFDAVFTSQTKDMTGIIASTTVDSYYILIQNTAAGSQDMSQNIVINAKIAQFELIDVYPTSVIKGADITLRLTGALFEPDLQAHLITTNEKISSKKMFVFSSTEAYGTFSIPQTMTTLEYSLQIESSSRNTTVSFSDKIHIVNGTKGYVTVSMNSPETLRFGEVGTLVVNLVNEGDSDVLVPLVLVSATGEGEFRLIDNSKEHIFTQNMFLFGATTKGPAGILPPKSSSVLRFETREFELSDIRRVTEMGISVSILKPSVKHANPLLKQKQTLKELEYDDNEWNLIWDNILLIIGKTTFSLINKMSEILNEMSVAGRRVLDVDDIVKYIIKFADAPPGVKTLSLDTDIIMEPESSFPLAIVRFLSSRKGSRAQEGHMGHGWILPLWDTAIKEVKPNTMMVTLDKRDFVFMAADTQTYIHKDIGIIKHEDGYYRLNHFNDDKVYNYNNQTLRLQSIVSVTRDGRIDMEYTGDTLTTIKHSRGSYVTINYDTFGRISSMDMKNSSFSRQSSQSYYEYDPERGMLYKSVVNTRLTKYVYYNDRSLKYVKNDDGSLFAYEYSNMGHMTSRRYVLNNQEVSGLEYSYINEAKVVVTTKPNGVQSTLTFNEHGEAITTERSGRLPIRKLQTTNRQIVLDGDSILLRQDYYPENKHIRIKDGSNDKIDVYFDNEGHLIQFNDGGDNIYRMLYDDNGTLGSVIYPDGSNKTYSYADFTDIITTQNGLEKRYEYDNKHQLILKDIGNEDVTSFEYNDDGYVTKATNENGKLEIKYNDFVPVEVQANADKLEYAYNDQGFISGISCDNYKVLYEYDSFGHMAKVINGQTSHTLVNVEYNNNGKIKRKILGNNATVNYEYDATSGLLTRLTNTYPDGTIASYFKYTYSKHNRRISMETVDGLWQFKYDTSGQVTYMQSPAGQITKYVYDNRKNRKIVNIDDKEVKTSVNNMNQYQQYGDTNVSYDKNGNVIQKENKGNVEQFKYDEETKLRMLKVNGQNCTLTYDSFGHLQTKVCNGVRTLYVTDPFGIHGGNIIKQTVGEGPSKRVTRFYHGGEQIGLVAMADETDTYYFQFDPIGSVVGILNAHGDLTNFYKSDPFGEVLETSEAIQTPFTYVGQWGVVRLSNVASMFLMRSRVYDAQFGRFTSIDTYGIRAKSKNFYAYCFNNPVHFSDPEGTCPLCWAAAFGALEGGFNYYMDHRGKGDFTWGGAAGAVAYGAVDGTLGAFKKFGIAISSVKSGLKYAYDHRNGGYSLKGQALALGQGALDGLIDSTKLSLGENLYLKGLSNAGFKALERGLNNEKSGFGETLKDFIGGAAGGLESKIFGGELGKYLKRGCILSEVATVSKISLCRPKDTINDIVKSTEELIKDFIRWIRSIDPNDVLGPPGHGAARFIKKDEILSYKIRFENDANATAPAQRVYVEHKFSKHLDARFFVLGEFGFGNVSQNAPHESQIFQTSLNVTRQYGVYVRVVAGLDIVNRLLFWEFQALDPETGEAPRSPSVGFLPPNNGTTGQGYVTFSVKPISAVPHLAVINANASIYFDENEPIDTPNIFNTIDDTPPTVTGTLVVETQSSQSITVSLNSSDSGAGVQYVDVFLKEDDGMTLFSPGITEDYVILNLEKSSNYTFVPIAVDYVGNRVPVEQAYDEFVVEAYVETSTCDCSGNGVCTIGANTCICEDGFYGATCNSTIQPLEPPVLQLRSSLGYNSKPTQLLISARNLSGTLESLSLNIKGFPVGTTFSKGRLNDNNALLLSFTEFGSINMTVTGDFTGILVLDIEALQEVETRTLSRQGHLEIEILPYDGLAKIYISGCFIDVDNEKVVKFDLTITVHSNIADAPLTARLTLPSWARVANMATSVDDTYTIPSNVSGQVIRVNGHNEPLTVKVAVDVSTQTNRLETVSKTVIISASCDEAPVTTPSAVVRVTRVTIKTNIVLLPTDDLTNATVYKKIKLEASKMLMLYYQKEIDGFIRTNIISLWKGSLFIEHNVEMMDGQTDTDALLLAVQEFHKTEDLLFFNQSVSVQEVTLGDIKVENKETYTDDEVCSFFEAIRKCQDGYLCVVEAQRPTCSLRQNPTPETKNESTDIVIPLVVALSLAGVVMIIVVCVDCKNRRKQKRNSDTMNSKSFGQPTYSGENEVTVPLNDI